MKNLSRNKKALSPVIATVILISVTIVVAVSVAYWMGSIAGGFTSFEQIELPTVYAQYDAKLFGTTDAPLGGWKVYIDLKNTGSAAATIENIFLNGKPLKDFVSESFKPIKLFVTIDDPTKPEYVIDLATEDISIKVPNGASEKVIIYIQEKDADGKVVVAGCTSGTRVDFKLHSAGGKDYPAQVKLP